MIVPDSFCKKSPMFSRLVITARLVVLSSTKLIQASTFGSIDPAANSAFSTCCFSSSTLTLVSDFCSGVLYPTKTFGTAVRTINKSASIWLASVAEAKSLSITASRPSKPNSLETTGTPPPPAAIGITPAASRLETMLASTTSTGLGDATSRR